MGVGCQHHNTATLPLGKRPRRLGKPQGQFMQVWKISSSPGINLQTVQPVVNHCSDYVHNEREEDTEFLKLAHKVVSSTHVYEMG